MLHDLVSQAIKLDATDIHFEISNQQVSQIKLRIFGRLRGWKLLPTEIIKGALASAYSKRTKSGTNSAGALSFERPMNTITEQVVNLKTYNGRFNGYPLVNGYDVVMRLLDSDPSSKIPSIQSLGYSAYHVEAQILPAIRRNAGMMIIAGSTGSGKSTTVAGLLYALSDPNRYPSARILVLDIHGEYAKALADRAAVFHVSADVSRGQQALHVPFWALSFEELSALAFGKLGDENGAKTAAVADAIVQLKKDALRAQPRDGIDESRVTVDTPTPFCIHKLWFDLHQREHQTVMAKPGGAQDELQPAFVLDENNQPLQIGDAMSVIPPIYRTVKTSGPKDQQINWSQSPAPLGLRQQLAGLASKLRDPRLAFLFNPGEWLPDIDGKVEKDLDTLLQSWIGGSNPISILDLSGIPSSILNELIGALLRILYDTVFWARNLPEGGRERPLLMVLEEAHAYLSKENSGSASAAVRRIAKEGRKYGVGMMIVSQRPVEIDSTILSQCGTIFALRLSNETDRGHVISAASDNLQGLFEMLPVLRTGEAIIVGEAVSLPVRTLITPPPLDRRPDSIDPKVVERGNMVDGFQGPGGWGQRRDPSDYVAVVRQWRKQSPHYDHNRPADRSLTDNKEE